MLNTNLTKWIDLNDIKLDGIVEFLTNNGNNIGVLLISFYNTRNPGRLAYEK